MLKKLASGVAVLFFLAFLVCRPAVATSTVSSFEAKDGKSGYDFEFYGYSDESPAIQFNGAGGPKLISREHFKLKQFDSRKKIIEIEFHDMDGFSLATSFVLKVSGDAGVIKIGSRKIKGTASWVDSN